MRKLNEVIQQMLAEIPVDSDLYHSLQNIYTSVCYCAPESMGMWWREVAETLWSNIGDEPTEEWHYKVIKIWNPDVKEADNVWIR